jgi:hypothetical protein
MEIKVPQFIGGFRGIKPHFAPSVEMCVHVSLLKGQGGSSMTNLNNSGFHLPYNPALVPRVKELRKNMTLEP